MSTVISLVALLSVFAWLNSYITAGTFWTIVIFVVLLDIIWSRMTLAFGFVSKAKYESLKAENDKAIRIVKGLTEALEEAREKIQKFDEYYYTVDEMEKIKERAIFSGQDAVFKAYVLDKVVFQKHLNDFIARETAKEGKKRKTASNNTKSSGPAWYNVLGVPKDTDYAAAKAAYRKLCMQFHPDKPGGSEDKMKTVNVAWSQAEAHFAR